jgi:hypothetical protein
VRLRDEIDVQLGENNVARELTVDGHVAPSASSPNHPGIPARPEMLFSTFHVSASAKISISSGSFEWLM